MSKLVITWRIVSIIKPCHTIIQSNSLSTRKDMGDWQIAYKVTINEITQYSDNSSAAATLTDTLASTLICET